MDGNEFVQFCRSDGLVLSKKKLSINQIILSSEKIKQFKEEHLNLVKND